MPLNFYKPTGQPELKISETTFRFARLSSADREALKRQCYEEGKAGIRLDLNETMFDDKLLEAALIGWENYVVAGSDDLFVFSEENKKEFIDHGDDEIKRTLAAFIRNPSKISAIFLESEKKG